MVWSGCKWLEWLILSVNGCKGLEWLNMAEHGWKWPELIMDWQIIWDFTLFKGSLCGIIPSLVREGSTLLMDNTISILLKFWHKNCNTNLSQKVSQKPIQVLSKMCHKIWYKISHKIFNKKFHKIYELGLTKSASKVHKKCGLYIKKNSSNLVMEKYFSSQPLLLWSI